MGMGLALLTASLCGADEVFPVVHNEPITVRLVGGKDGQPLVHAHLILVGGYDENDIRHGLWQQETLTDEQGRARLSKALANLPFLQVWVGKKHLCEANVKTSHFSVELIRRDGLSAPNRCGTAVVEDAPGVFTVYVKSAGEKSLSMKAKDFLLPPRCRLSAAKQFGHSTAEAVAALIDATAAAAIAASEAAPAARSAPTPAKEAAPDPPASDRPSKEELPLNLLLASNNSNLQATDSLL
jgi:hypothetical protein